MIEEVLQKTVSDAVKVSFSEIEERFKGKLSAPPMWLTLKEVCQYLRLSETKVRELIKSGFPCSTVGGDKRFFRPDVDKFMRGEL